VSTVDISRSFMDGWYREVRTGAKIDVPAEADRRWRRAPAEVSLFFGIRLVVGLMTVGLLVVARHTHSCARRHNDRPRIRRLPADSSGKSRQPPGVMSCASVPRHDGTGPVRSISIFIAGGRRTTADEAAEPWHCAWKGLYGQDQPARAARQHRHCRRGADTRLWAVGPGRRRARPGRPEGGEGRTAATARPDASARQPRRRVDLRAGRPARRLHHHRRRLLRGPGRRGHGGDRPDSGDRVHHLLRRQQLAPGPG
jgi:hypothetical protein